MLAAKYPENVELLGCDTEKRKELLLVANKPVGCIDKVYHRLLVDAMEGFLLDFVFDLHEQGKAPGLRPGARYENVLCQALFISILHTMSTSSETTSSPPARRLSHFRL